MIHKLLFFFCLFSLAVFLIRPFLLFFLFRIVQALQDITDMIFIQLQEHAFYNRNRTFLSSNPNCSCIRRQH